MHDETFVFRVTLPNEGQSSGIQTLFTGFHAPAVIDDEAQTEGNIFMLEHCDVLFRPVFKYMEIFLFQISDWMVLLISDTDMHLGEINVHIELEVVVFLCPN